MLRVQTGLMPNSYKPMNAVGAGAYEIRVQDADSIARLIYVAKFRDTICVLHVFTKKAQRTPKTAIAITPRSATERQEMANSVFHELVDTPEQAANLTARGLLMIAIEQRIREEGWTQAEAAKCLHVTQPRVSDLLNGKVSKFSLDALVNMLAPVGLAFDVRPVECSSVPAAKKVKRVRADGSARATSNERKVLSAN